MNKQDLLNELAGLTGETKASADRFLSALGTVATKELKAGGEITIPEIGKLVAGVRAARTVNSPVAGGKLDVPAANVAKFKAAKALKDALN